MRPTKLGATLVAAVLLLPAPGVARAASPSLPTTGAIINLILSPPKQAFQGHVMVNHWNGSKTKAEDINIFYKPSDNYRMEFLAPNGTIDRVVKSNRFGEQAQLVTNGKITSDVIIKRPPKILTPENEKALLVANYRVDVSETEPFLGRSVWRVVWQPLTGSKPVNEMRVDRATGVVLESKRFTSSGGDSGTLLRFIQFTPLTKASSAPALFLAEKDVTGIDDELGLAATIKAPLSSETEMARLYGGFSVESVDDYEVLGKPVRHIRYTDGLLPISLFRTAMPVTLPASATSSDGSFRLADVGPGEVCHWEKDKTYYTLIGDLPAPLLQEIAHHLE